MPPGIVIVGLGPGNPEQITREAWSVLAGADEVYLRTAKHPTVATLPTPATYHAFDGVYEAHSTFAEVYEEIAQQVVALGQRSQGVVYAVPGHPLVGETTVLRVLAMARGVGLPTRIVAGVSFLEPTLTALGLDAFDGLQICDATLLAQQHHPNLDPDRGALLVQVYNRQLASDVKLTLMNLYSDGQPLRLVRCAGTGDQEVRDLLLFELDRQEGLDHLTTVYIPPLAHLGSLASFQNIVARLRAPGGCPWDREQTHASLRKSLLEETYEVLEALDADDMPSLREELGDLLLQVLLHTQIATEGGDWKFIDVVQHVVEKLIRRHPHVFGEVKVAGAEDVLRNWELIKRAEKTDPSTSLLANVPAALPALSRAQAMQQRAARVGFDWPNVEPVLAKVVEELQEFRQATDAAERAAELGDLLFSLVNLARWCEIDAEDALRETNQRFASRFGSIERRAVEAGTTLDKMTLAEMDVLWEDAKREEER